MSAKVELIKAYLLDLQQHICACLQEEDGGALFVKDRWERENGGFGYSCALEGGKVIEKAGVNFSHIFGACLPQAASQKHPELAGRPFEATGISVIVHPRNPFAPTVHFNTRFLSSSTKEKEIWWFGGGFDLTPYYGFTEDCIHWHEIARAACQPFGEDIYSRFKKWADDYFYLPHRKEPRGIGGLFFDDFWLENFDISFEFMRSIGTHFLLAYLPLLQKRKHLSFTEAQRDFQRYRRGRYVEFNLLQDRGTLFGLQWGGRVESILISLPPEVTWRYNWAPAPGSEEARLYEEFLPPREWV